MRMLAGLMLAACAGAAWAQEAATVAETPPVREAPTAPRTPPWHRNDRLTIRVEPGVQYLGMSGVVVIPRADEDSGGNPNVDLHDLNLDEPRVAPFGEVHLRRGDWRGTLRAVTFATDREATNRSGSIGDIDVDGSDFVRSSLEYSSFEAEVGYTVYPSDPGRRMDGPAGVRRRLDLVAGVRVIDVAFDIRNLSFTPMPGAVGDADVEEVYVHPIVGVKGSVEIWEHLTLDAQLDVGTLPLLQDSSYSASILVGGTWKPVDNVGVQIGYRAMFFGLTSGEGDAQFDFTGQAQGLYAGLVFEF